MKKLSKDERIGAATLAVVALVVCGGAFFAKRMGKKEHASPEIIKSIILASEEEGGSEGLTKGGSEGLPEENFEAPKAPHTETNASGHKERMGEDKKRKGEDKKKEGKRNKKAKKREGEAKKAASPPRDHLAEPI